MSTELCYGMVLITKGTHAGEVGYYDDDDGPYAIVYLGAPCLSEPVRVRSTSMCPADPEDIQLWRAEVEQIDDLQRQYVQALKTEPAKVRTLE